MLAQLGETVQTSAPLARGVEYLRRTQLADGSWFGRWGVNYIYGTWSVLCALNAAGVDHSDPVIAKAADWLIAIQNPDGGWGEDGNSYKLEYRGYEKSDSTASQTAWATLALMAAGKVDHPAVQRGIAYLIQFQGKDGLWRISHPNVAQQYRLNVGTIIEAPLLNVRISRNRGAGFAGRGGRVLGKIEEYFIETMSPGDTFLFAGLILRFEGIHENEVVATRTADDTPKIPIYAGGKFPLSTYLAAGVRAMLADEKIMRLSGGTFITAEMAQLYNVTDTDGRVIPSLRAERGAPIWQPISAYGYGNGR